MKIVDRHITARFLWNFAVLFSLLYVFAVSIDVILQLDRFFEAADGAVATGRFSSRTVALLAAIFNFHGPRVFQFYAYLLGLVTVAAMGFTLAQMHRYRELTALLSAGMSLRRVALPLLVASIGLNLLQLANAEYAIPRLAPMLMREHGDILSSGMTGFAVPLTPDSHGRLLMARSFEPASESMVGVLVLERNANGATQRRITADRARWDSASRTWRLENGIGIRRPGSMTDPLEGEILERRTVEAVETDLDPRALAIRRSATFAQMLSLAQLRDIEKGGGVDQRIVERARWTRFTGVIANVLILLIALPSFLLREPANLIARSLECSIVTIGAMLVALVGMTVNLPGVSPALGAAIPMIVLAPLAIARITGTRT